MDKFNVGEFYALNAVIGMSRSYLTRYEVQHTDSPDRSSRRGRVWRSGICDSSADRENSGSEENHSVRAFALRAAYAEGD